MKKIIILTVGIFTFLLFFFTLLFHLSEKLDTQVWLSTNKKVKSNLLIIEGWLNPNFFNTILSSYNSKQYNKILITGTPIPQSVSLYVNGQIIIKNPPIDKTNSNTLNHIQFKLYGTDALNEYSKCKIYKNDSLLSGGEIRGDSTIHLYTHLKNSDSLVVEFVNDAYKGTDDRNLTLKELQVDAKKIDLRTKNIWLNYKNVYHTNNFTSNSERAVLELQKMGVKKQDIHFIYTRHRGVSKTYDVASEAIKWMKKNNYSKANIITLSYHSKRTLLSFNKACPNLEFGIQSIQFYPSRLRTIKEIVGNILIKVVPKFILDLKLKTT